MELKKKKFINNTKLPKYEFGLNNKSAQYGGIIGFYPGLPGSIAPSEGYVGSFADPLNVLKYNEYLKQYRQNRQYFSNKNNNQSLQLLKGGQNILNNLGNMAAHTGAVISSFTPESTVDSTLANGTQNYRNIGGVYYKTNDIDTYKELSDSVNRNNTKWLNSALTGSLMMMGFKDGKLPKFNMGANAMFGLMGGALLGGIGKAVTEGKERDVILKAKDIADRQNNFNKFAAYDTVVKDNMVQQYGDTRNQLLSFKCGKLPKFNLGKKSIQSPFGDVYGKANCRVDGDELMIEQDDYGNVIAAHQVPPSKHVDSYLAWAGPNTTIIPANIVKKMQGYKDGKLPKYELGVNGYEGVLANLPTAIGGIAKVYRGTTDSQKTSNSFVPNKFGNYAADKLRRLRVSDYPILPELYNQYGRTMYAISNSGGLSGGLRTLARLSAMNNLQNNYAKLLLSNQLQNNNFTANYADYISKLGAQEATDRMRAYQFDLDYNSKAHAAKENLINSGWYDIANAAQHAGKSAVEANQFKELLKIWRAQNNIKQEEINARAEEAARLAALTREWMINNRKPA